MPLLTAACASAPGVPGSHALVRAFVSGNPDCGPDTSPLCEARVVRVDGERVFPAYAVPVAPGRRRLGVFCRMNPGIMIGDEQWIEREIEADLAPGGRYRIDARMTPEPCTVSLVREKR